MTLRLRGNGENPGYDAVELREAVQHSLMEDVGSGDLTAALINEARRINAVVVCRDNAVMCGTGWFDEVFSQLDSAVEVHWTAADGDDIGPGQTLCRLRGRARPVLTGERSALNWLQTLSGTATVTRRYVNRVAGTEAVILDTRKTLPGLRLAQKYAVRCGGGNNHRRGLYDGVLIKENHLRSGDSIASVLKRAVMNTAPGTLIEIEVDTLDQLAQALEAGAQRVLLDNFTMSDLRRATAINQGRAKLEASGNIDLDNVREMAETGVDYISIGALTKHVYAVDLSMEFSEAP